MIVKNGAVEFSDVDMRFVEKFGIFKATEMVLDFYNLNKTPFIYDTYQLADFLGYRRRTVFLVTKDPESFYFPTEIPKRDGTARKLLIPDTLIMSMQRHILDGILKHLKPSRYATAYAPKTNIKQNAQPHIGKKYILKTDISDFFGSVRFEQVYSAAFNIRLFPKQIGVMLTELCCYNGYLPQGAPTSPALSNLVMKNFDNNIGYWCEKHGISYTRYCDDMTFSSDKPLYNVLQKLTQMLDEMGFELNAKKTKFVTSSSRQSVTGLTVNERLSVSRDYKRNLRQELYYGFKFGLEGAISRTKHPEFFDDNNHFMHESYYNSLLGRVRYILSIEPNNTEFSEALDRLKQYDMYQCRKLPRIVY